MTFKEVEVEEDFGAPVSLESMSLWETWASQKWSCLDPEETPFLWLKSTSLLVEVTLSWRDGTATLLCLLEDR